MKNRSSLGISCFSSIVFSCEQVLFCNHILVEKKLQIQVNSEYIKKTLVVTSYTQKNFVN